MAEGKLYPRVLVLKFGGGWHAMYVCCAWHEGAARHCWPTNGGWSTQEIAMKHSGHLVTRALREQAHRYPQVREWARAERARQIKAKREAAFREATRMGRG